MKSFLSLLVFCSCLVLLSSDADFNYSSGTCNNCDADIQWHTLCSYCGHVMCDYLEMPFCKMCGKGSPSFSGTFDPDNPDPDNPDNPDPDNPDNPDPDNPDNPDPDNPDNPGDNPLIKSQTSSGGVTVTTYTDGSTSIQGSDGGSGPFDLKPESDLSVTFRENGTKVVSGTDTDGNPFSFTVLPDGSSFNGTHTAYLDSPELGTNTTTVPGLDSGDSDNPFFGDGNDPFVLPDNPIPDNPIPDNPDPDNPDPDNPDPDNPDPDNPIPDNPGGDDGGETGGETGGDVGKVEVTNWPVTKLSYLPRKPDLLDSIDSDSSFWDTFCRKLLPHLPSVSGSNDIFIPIDFDLSAFPVNLGRLSFVLGGFHTVLDGALVPVMAFSRAFSILLFVFFFSLSVVRALRQW